MDISVIERLAPHLAWPIAGLIALPFVVWRLGAVGSLYSMLSGSKFAELMTLVEKLESKLSGIQAQMSAMEQSRLWEQVDKLPTTHKTLQGEGLKPEVLYDRINSKWSELEQIIENKLNSFGEPYDRRTVNGALLVLTSSKRKRPLTPQDGQLIAELHSVLKSFRRLKDNMDDWLTPDVYTSFIASVDDVKAKVQLVS